MNTNDSLILDGAMGTMLQAAGLPVGKAPELLNTENPKAVTEIARQYIKSGSNIVYSNTFGANRLKLPNCNISEVVAAGIFAAKEAAKESNALVALDIGPIGRLLAPLGDLSFDEAYDIFKEVIIAGKNAGADIIVFETMSDLYEAKAGLLAAKENSDLPVWVTMTFEENQRTFVGVTVPAMALTLSALGADAIGFNCSLGPSELLPLIKTLSEWTDLPIILKPNAGLPNPETGKYSVTAEQFANQILKAAELGVSIFGGCCGTTPEFIAAIKQKLKGKAFIRPKRVHNGVCSATAVADFGRVNVVGERINPTGKKRFAKALRELDYSYIVNQGIEQQNAHADILDVNVGLPDINETEVLKQTVISLQEVVDLPLQIDSSNPQAIEQALRYYNGKAIVNSVNGDEETLNAVLPLCKKYGAAVVGLTMDKNGIPLSEHDRIKIAERILLYAEKYGINRQDVIIDCLTLTLSAQQDAAQSTLKALRHISRELKLNTTLGVSNISFGLPSREVITAAFLTEALSSGLNLPIINPNSAPVMDAVFAHNALHSNDIGCAAYIERFNGAAETAAVKPFEDITLTDCILKGLKEQTAALTKKALNSMSEIDVINNLLIPALDLVGESYEKQEIFLPQLINASMAACEGFDIIKARLKEKGSGTISKGKIIVATVKGDIHDIGKNIVKVVLENYGYTVIDLGRDVSPEVIVNAAIKQDVRLIGLSALMTTTVVSMEQTVKALRQSGHDCKIWVGGAVVTEEYAKKIGADYYAKDAKQSVDIAKEVLG